MKRSILVAAAAALAFSAVTASADSWAASPRSRIVRYDDLDLNTNSGVAALYGRVRASAMVVCGAIPNIRWLSVHAEYAQCVRLTIENAIGTVDNATLKQYARAVERRATAS